MQTGLVTGTKVIPIYLDHNATTPLDPEVRAEMEACLNVRFSFGRENTQEGVSRAVDLVAQAVESMRGDRR